MEQKQTLVQRISRRMSLGGKKKKLGEDVIKDIAARTSLSREEVEGRYKKFLRHHPSGMMDRAGLRATLQKSLPGLDSSGLAEHIWRIYDANQDDQVDFGEFMLALSIMGSGSAEENLKLIYRLFDINSDGKVEKEELGRVVEELNKLGEVGEDVVQRAFAEMDADRDGGVTEEEFVRACLQQRGAATALTIRVIDIFVAS
jgi:Ca2+-binding EF-hand superfamily protein